jgi:hypothetical protein
MSSFLGVNNIQPVTDTRGIVKISADMYQGDNGKGVKFTDLRNLGLDSYSFADFCVRRFGTFYQSFDFLAKVVNPGYKMVGLNSSKWVIPTGAQRVRVNFVKSTITPDGTYDRVEIEMAGPGGNGADWYSEGHVLVGKNNRQFEVKKIGKSAAGFQTLVVKPMDNVPNIQVIAGECIYFLNGSFPGELGVNAKLGKCRNQFVTRTYNHTERTFEPMRKMESYTMTRETIQNDIKAIDFWVFNDGKGNQIGAFIDQQRIDQHYEFQKQRNAALFWQEPQLDLTIEEYRGGGLVPQIPNDFKRFLNPTQITYSSIMDTITEWDTMNYGYLGEDILMLCGPHEYMQVQSILEHTPSAKLEYRMEPNMSFKEASREQYIGRLFGGMWHAWGHNIYIKNVKEWMDPSISGDSSIVSPNAGMHTHDIILMDPGQLSNFDPKLDQWKKEGVSKIQTFTNKQPNGALNNTISVYTDGLIDRDGNNKSGMVRTFDATVEFYDEATEGIALVDDRSMFYISPFNAL